MKEEKTRSYSFPTLKKKKTSTTTYVVLRWTDRNRQDARGVGFDVKRRITFVYTTLIFTVKTVKSKRPL